MHTTALLQPGSSAITSTELAQHLLVVANETLEGEGLVDAVERLVAPDGEVIIVCPVLVSRARYWTSDLSAGIARAHDRLLRSLDTLHRRGISGEGAVGDGHPLLAIEDAVRARPIDHILIVTLPPSGSLWLERGLIERARVRFDQPISHAVGYTSV
jgi:hypothetical protein